MNYIYEDSGAFLLKGVKGLRHHPLKLLTLKIEMGRRFHPSYMAANTGAVCMSWVSGHSVEPNSTGKVPEAQGDSTQAGPRPKPSPLGPPAHAKASMATRKKLLVKDSTPIPTRASTEGWRDLLAGSSRHPVRSEAL